MTLGFFFYFFLQKYHEEIDDLVEEEYLQEGDVLEEEIPDLDQGEPMDDDDEDDMDGTVVFSKLSI